ncbi:MAG: hypothetical protein ACRCUM_01355 [Mycoplasmoidaceae bacterium]
MIKKELEMVINNNGNHGYKERKSKYDYIDNPNIAKKKIDNLKNYMKAYSITKEELDGSDTKTHFIKFTIVNLFRVSKFWFQKQIAFLCDCSIGLVKKIYAELIKDGILIKRKNQNGKKNKRLYIFTWFIREDIDVYSVQKTSRFAKYLSNRFISKRIVKNKVIEETSNLDWLDQFDKTDDLVLVDYDFSDTKKIE